MSSKEKRKSSLFHTLGFAGLHGHALPMKSEEKRRTIVLPKMDGNNKLISEADLSGAKVDLKSGQGLPLVPLPKNSIVNSNSKPSETRSTTVKVPLKVLAPLAPVKPPLDTLNIPKTRAPVIDPIKSMQSDLSLQRSNSPGLAARKTLVRKPPPSNLPKHTSAPTQQTPTQQTPTQQTLPTTHQPSHTHNKSLTKPDLEKLITSIEGDVSDFNPSSALSDGVSPVPSSVYSPYSPLNLSADPNKVRSTSNLVASVSASDLNDIDSEFQDELKKIEDLLNESSLLNEQIDHHLSHSRNASWDPAASNNATSNNAKSHNTNDQDDVVESDDDSLSVTSTESDDKQVANGDGYHSSILKDVALPDLHSIVKNESLDTSLGNDISLFGSPALALSKKFGSEQVDTTDDEFYDAENGDRLPLETDRASFVTSSSDEDPDEDLNARPHFQVVNGDNLSSPELDNSAPDETVDVSSDGHISDPFNLLSPRSVKKRFSMDAVDGHDSNLSIANNILYPDDNQTEFYRYDGRDYLEDVDGELQKRYIDEQEDFYQNHNVIETPRPLSHRRVPSNIEDAALGETEIASTRDSSNDYTHDSASVGVTSFKHDLVAKFDSSSSSSSSDSADNDRDSEQDEELSFTVRSPFYSPFDQIDDDQPRKMVVTNNVSDQESEDDEEQPKENNSYFAGADIKDYASEDLFRSSNTNSLQVPESVEEKSASITSQDGQLTHMYDRRGDLTVDPVTYSQPTSSAVNPAVSPGLLEAPKIATKKPLRRRPPPDFPVAVRAGRSISVNKELQPVFDERTPYKEEIQQDVQQTKSAPETTVLHPGEGERSSYVDGLRRKAGSSYSDVGPPKWKLPVAIRSDSEKNKLLLSNKYSKTTMSLFKKGVLSSADIKHGNLRPRLLASEVDDEELNKVETNTTTTSNTNSSLAHTQLGSMIPPQPRISNELYLTLSKTNSVYSNNSNGSGPQGYKRQSSLANDSNRIDFEDYMAEELGGVKQTFTVPKINDIGDLNRSVSVRSYLPGAAPNGKMKLFVVNPDTSDDE